MDKLAALRQLLYVPTVEDLTRCVLDIGEAQGFDHFVYVARRADRLHHSFDVVLTGTPAQWWPHYTRMGYATIDPIVEQCLLRVRSIPMVWHDEQFDTPDRQALRDDARKAGLKAGVSLSLGFGTPYRAKLSLISGSENRDSEAWSDQTSALIGFLGAHLHEAVARFSAVQVPSLSAREHECLRWTAAGKTAEETARILSMSPSTARFHLENAKRKLEASNLVQAVARAIRLGLIEP